MAPIARTAKRGRSPQSSAQSSALLFAMASYLLSTQRTSCEAAFVGPATRPACTPASATFRAMRTDDNDRRESSPMDMMLNFMSSEQRKKIEKDVATVLTTVAFSAAIVCNPIIQNPSAHAEDELYAKYGNKGFDSSLVDKDCLVDKCSLQAKACLGDDPECRKGLTCTAKCLGDNACITGCFARYGTPNLDNLLKCTIEDHECIKVAILEGGADAYGSEPRSPAPTVSDFKLASMEGTWYKVSGYNPNYDCYACQRNTFSAPEGGLSDKAPFLPTGGALGSALGADRLQLDVEFSMPRMLPDGSPPPPSGVRESSNDGFQSIGYNAYATHETMVFDTASNKALDLVMKQGTDKEQSYARTAHSEGEMFGLKFWENWYIIGENDPGQDEFKFVYYNGKTRQNTYEGGFVYSRSRSLSPSSMEKVYKIASDAGMNPDQFCKINNGCFEGEDASPSKSDKNGSGSPAITFKGILASTKVSEFFGVESVAAESTPRSRAATQISPQLKKVSDTSADRPWWKEAGDYFEDPHRHFKLMDSLRADMDWPEYIKAKN